MRLLARDTSFLELVKKQFPHFSFNPQPKARLCFVLAYGYGLNEELIPLRVLSDHVDWFQFEG